VVVDVAYVNVFPVFVATVLVEEGVDSITYDMHFYVIEYAPGLYHLVLMDVMIRDVIT